MIVVCLEGCHGSGKTQLCRKFAQDGFMVLDEAFLDMPSYSLHPQTLLMETTWVCSWFQRLLAKSAEMRCVEGEQIFIADRSPFSAVFYARHGHLLEPVIREQMREVLEAADIRIITVHVRVEPELLWQRIQDRLLREPIRMRYKEDKREWMEATLKFYNSFAWDLTVNNDEDHIGAAMQRLVNALCATAPMFQHSMQHGHHLESFVLASLQRAASQSPQDALTGPPQDAACAASDGSKAESDREMDADEEDVASVGQPASAPVTVSLVKVHQPVCTADARARSKPIGELSTDEFARVRKALDFTSDDF